MKRRPFINEREVASEDVQGWRHCNRHRTRGGILLELCRQPGVFPRTGETGVIGAVKVPKVIRTPGGNYFCCVDFVKDGRNGEPAWTTGTSSW